MCILNNNASHFTPHALCLLALVQPYYEEEMQSFKKVLTKERITVVEERRSCYAFHHKHTGITASGNAPKIDGWLSQRERETSFIVGPISR